MSQLLYFPNVARRRQHHDDLAKARGMAIAVLAGLAFWATMFVIAHWLVG